MVAIIKSSHSIHRILNYNENKVKQGKAACIAAANYPVDAGRLTFMMKLRHFERQMELNSNVRRNSVHISLNFDASEKDMATEKLLQIAEVYMEKIGFGKQPYLAYRHFDAGHPHIHLVTTNIRPDGSRIDLHHLAIRKSEPARKAIEAAFGLVMAQGRIKQPGLPVKASAGKAMYGKSETRAAIQNVLEVVIDKYRYTSLEQLNAVLQLYNIRADQGSEASWMRRHGGLLYRIIDDKGNAVGVPIKASLFHNSPTLAKLAVKFSVHSIMAAQHKAGIKNVIDRLSQENAKPGFQDMEANLAREGISMVLRQSNTGQLYGLTYVDHRTGGVFNGSALGKQYSAKQMQERFPSEAGPFLKDVGIDGKSSVGQDTGHDEKNFSNLDKVALANPEAAILLQEIAGILEGLSRAEQFSDFVPGQLKRKRKKRKRGPWNKL